MTAFPAAVYEPRTKENKAGIVYDEVKTEIGYAEDVTKLDDEVVAIETELGTNPKGTSADVAERIKGIKSLADADADVIIIKAGDIGIGETVPQSNLHISGGYATHGIGQNVAVFEDSGANYPAIIFAGVAGIHGGLRIENGDGFSFYTAANGVFGASNVYKNVLRLLENGNIGIGVVDPHSKLEVAGAISSAALNLAADTDDLDVSGVNIVFLTMTEDIVVGGFSGGVAGQVIQVVYKGDGVDKATFEQEEPDGTQKFFMHTRADEDIKGGGWTFVCDGVDWYDVSHAKHV